MSLPGGWMGIIVCFSWQEVMMMAKSIFYVFSSACLLFLRVKLKKVVLTVFCHLLMSAALVKVCACGGKLDLC